MFNILISYYRTACKSFISKIKNAKKSMILGLLYILKTFGAKKLVWHINCSTKWKNKDLKTNYNCINRSVKAEIFKAKILHEKEKISKSQNNSKLVYKYINNQIKIRSLKNTSGKITEILPDVLELLNS